MHKSNFINTKKVVSTDGTSTLIGFDASITQSYKALRKLVEEHLVATTVAGYVYFNKLDLPDTLLFWCTKK
jgi:hypothetical protein